MDIIIVPLLQLINTVIHLYTWAIIIYVILSWLLMFNIVNAQNKFVSLVVETLFRITEPLLGAIRRVLPNMGGLDLSPIVLILGLYFLESFINRLALRFI
ncbi:MAG: YggT family protein [Candidatus Nucleicultricaceae bacterium]